MTDEIIQYRFRVRRRTALQWQLQNEVLLDSEYGLEIDTRKLKLGDGVTPWNSLPYLESGLALALLSDVDATDRADRKALIWDEATQTHVYGSAGAAYVAGGGIDIDDTDPDAPVISSTLGSIALSGRVATYAALPGGLGSGDSGKAYLVDADDRVYVWSGAAFPSSGNGIAIGSRPKYMHVYRSSDQTSSGISNVEVVFDTVVVDEAGIWDAVSHSAVIAAPGLYDISYQNRLTSGPQRDARIKVNGTDTILSVGATGLYLRVNGVLWLEAGDVITVSTSKSSTAASTYTGGINYAALRIAGPL